MEDVPSHGRRAYPGRHGSRAEGRGYLVRRRVASAHPMDLDAGVRGPRLSAGLIRSGQRYTSVVGRDRRPAALLAVADRGMHDRRGWPSAARQATRAGRTRHRAVPGESRDCWGSSSGGCARVKDEPCVALSRGPSWAVFRTPPEEAGWTRHARNRTASRDEARTTRTSNCASHPSRPAVRGLFPSWRY
jgi:hypothetical protein